MPRIAFLTFGILVEPWGNAAVAGFAAPTADAFDFHHPFGPDGQPTRLERGVATRTSPR